MNRATLIGNVGQEPAIKQIGDKKVAKFSLAISKQYKKNGEKVTETTWHNIVIWSPIAEIVEKYVNKGNQIFIEGEIRYRTYDDANGISHDVTEIICNNLQLLSNVKKEETQTRKDNKVDMPSLSDPDELSINAEDDPSYFPE